MTRLLEILISLAIVAALFLIVGVALPSSRHLSEKVETNRKMTIVYDTLNTPRRLKDWNPLALRDPQMQWEYSGPESGVGARVDYTSTNEKLGRGSWEIVASEPGRRVEYALANPQRGHDKKMTFLLKPTGRNNRNVEITQEYDVQYGWDLLGRYAGLYVSSHVGDDMKLGLNRLANMLAGVPNYDYALLGRDDPAKGPRLVEMPAENFLFVASAVRRDNFEVQKAMQNNLQWVRKVMDANGLEAAGPVRVVTTEFGSETYSFDIGIPVRKKGETGAGSAVSPKLEGPVEFARTEPARAAVASFTGHMANLPSVRDAVRAWALTRGYETVGRPFEAWKGGVDAGFSETGEFDVYWYVK
ncbi:SRPBCC family protein [Vulcaniibacterium gelatinicum]|uniref:SRPBCC family protein n=1 Tax=Vulcaniibacterium gelatinicum TaxID=2598725 RepID=UPI0011C7604A|nr:SRPBCC family protein [Vulcaniibacterium gelatinicum]